MSPLLLASMNVTDRGDAHMTCAIGTRLGDRRRRHPETAARSRCAPRQLRESLDPQPPDVQRERPQIADRNSRHDRSLAGTMR